MSPPGPAGSATSAVQSLQRVAGNRAATMALRRGLRAPPPVQRVPSTGLEVAEYSAAKRKRVSAHAAKIDAKWGDLVRRVASEMGFDPTVALAIIMAESGGNEKSAVSKAGYKGLMQAGKGKEHLDAEYSVRAGIRLFQSKEASVQKTMANHGVALSSLPPTDRIGLVMVAYNAGQGTFRKAVGYAAAEGDWRDWFEPRHMQRAMLYYGAYSTTVASRRILHEQGTATVAAHVAQLSGQSLDAVGKQFKKADGTWKAEALRRHLRDLLQADLQATRRKHDAWTYEDWKAKHPLLVAAAAIKHANQKAGYLAKVVNYQRAFARLAGDANERAAAVSVDESTPTPTPTPATTGGARGTSDAKDGQQGSGISPLLDVSAIVGGVLAGLGLTPPVIGALRAAFGIEVLTAMSAARTTDENKVTNEIFFARHPELGRRKIKPHERSLAAEWLAIRSTQVRPFLAAMSAFPAGTSTSPAAGADAAAGPAAPELAELMAAVKETDGRDRPKIDALIAYAREQTATYPELVDTYRAQPEPGAQEKVKVLGRAAAGIARMEYLLGQMRYRGGGWEGDGRYGANQGRMVDTYKAAWARDKASPWCTFFATSALARIYGRSARVGSGLKVGRERGGYDAGAAHGGKQVGVFSTNSTPDNNPFARLRVELENLDDPKARVKAANEFIAEEMEPQAGDIVIVRRSASAPPNSASGTQSHTLIVEGFSGTTMTLIEGNKGGRVRGRRLDLADAADVREIILISRPSLAAGASKKERASIGAGLPEGTSAVTESEIVVPIDTLNAHLEELARSVGVLAGDAPTGAAVADIHLNAGRVDQGQD